MFFFLSKILLFLLSPFFWMMLLIGFYFFRPQSRWKNYAKWTAIGLFFFFSNTVLFSEVCRWWEVPGSRIEETKKHEVAIVLGGMFEYNNDLDVLSIRRQGDRLIQAVTLYKKGRVEKLMISGDSGHLTDRGLHEARQIKELLLIWGIPEKDIITEEKSINTHENAMFSKQKLQTSYPHYSKFLLVTSGIHMKRALACFEKQGMHCTPYSTDLFVNEKGAYQWDQYLIPNASNFQSWNLLLKEMIGTLAYKLVGYA